MAHTNNTQPPPPRPEDRYEGPGVPPLAPPTTSSYGDLLAGAIVLLPTAGLIYWFVQVMFEKLGV